MAPTTSTPSHPCNEQETKSLPPEAERHMSINTNESSQSDDNRNNCDNGSGSTYLLASPEDVVDLMNSASDLTAMRIEIGIQADMTLREATELTLGTPFTAPSIESMTEEMLKEEEEIIRLLTLAAQLTAGRIEVWLGSSRTLQDAIEAGLAVPFTVSLFDGTAQAEAMWVAALPRVAQKQE